MGIRFCLSYIEDITRVVISYEMTTSVIFCLSYDLSKKLFITFNVDNISTKMHFCQGRRHDVTCSRRKC